MVKSNTQLNTNKDMSRESNKGKGEKERIHEKMIVLFQRSYRYHKYTHTYMPQYFLNDVKWYLTKLADEEHSCQSVVVLCITCLDPTCFWGSWSVACKCTLGKFRILSKHSVYQLDLDISISPPYFPFPLIC